jgi:hypothetical protein
MRLIYSDFLIQGIYLTFLEFIMAKSLILRSIQSVLFTNQYPLDNKLGFASEFVKRSSKIFSADPSIVTAPGNAPPQAPRIEIRSPDQAYIAQFFNNRITFQFQDVRNMRTSLYQIFPNYIMEIRNEIQYIMEFLNPRVTRIGFVVKFISELGYSSNQFFNQECFKNNLFPEAHETNLGVLNKLMLDRFSVNRWIRYKTLRAQNDPSIDHAMSIDVDINTPGEEMNDFSTSEILDFYNLSFEHITGNLGEYPLLEMKYGDGEPGN